MPRLTLKHASWALRLSGLLVFPALFVFNREILHDAADAMGDANLALLAAATVLMLAASIVRAMRWRVLAEASGVHYPHFLDYLSIYYAGLFLGAAVPQVAASFAPVVLMTEDGQSWRRATVSILFDRLVETLAILLVAFVAALYLIPEYTKLSAIVLLISGGAFTAVAFGGVLLVKAPRIIERIERGPLLKLRKITDMVSSGEARGLFRGIRSRAGQLAGLSFAVVLLQVSVVVLLAEALSLDASVVFLAAVAAMVVLVVMVPISFAGLGSREAMLVVLFTAAGEPKNAAVALGVLLFAVGLAARLPGVLGWVRRSTPLHVSIDAAPPAAEEAWRRI
jgi:uncharacterized protein (TIRG00374 family)